MKKINFLIGVLLLILSVPLFLNNQVSAVQEIHIPREPVRIVNEPTTPNRPIPSIPAIGILTHGKNTLPLYGRRLNRDRWVYHSMTDQFHSIMVPIRVKGKDSLDEYGVEQLYNDDHVTIDGHNDPYKVRLYFYS